MPKCLLLCFAVFVIPFHKERGPLIGQSLSSNWGWPGIRVPYDGALLVCAYTGTYTDAHIGVLYQTAGAWVDWQQKQKRRTYLSRAALIKRNLHSCIIQPVYSYYEWWHSNRISIAEKIACLVESMAILLERLLLGMLNKRSFTAHTAWQRREQPPRIGCFWVACKCAKKFGRVCYAERQLTRNQKREKPVVPRLESSIKVRKRLMSCRRE